MEINERIRMLRKSAKLNQKQFGERLGMGQGAVSWIEKDGNTVTEQNIKAICTTFNVSEKWLRNGEGDIFLSSRETLINRLKDELHLNDTEINILNIYVDLPQASRDAILNFAARVSTVFQSISTASPVVAQNATTTAAPVETVPIVNQSFTTAAPPKPEGVSDEEWGIIQGLRLEKNIQTSSVSRSIA